MKKNKKSGLLLELAQDGELLRLKIIKPSLKAQEIMVLSDIGGLFANRQHHGIFELRTKHPEETRIFEALSALFEKFTVREVTGIHFKRGKLPRSYLEVVLY